MPPIVVAAAATVATAFTTGFAGAVGFAALMSTSALTFFAVNAALGFALNALTPKVGISSGQGYQSNAIDSVADHQIIYGETKVGGVVVYKEATDNNKYLHKIIAIAGHEIDSFTQIYLNDSLLTIDGTGNVTSPSKYDGFVRINLHTGSPDQLADSDLVAESNSGWSSSHRLRGIAYIYARFKFNADKFPNGEPIITAVVKGKKVYDPRTGLTSWSDNSALCLSDYIRSDQGLSEIADNVDYTMVSVAANICDESVALAIGGTEKRYTTNGSFITSVTPSNVIDSLSRPMGGMIWFTQGKWRMKAAAWTTPVLTLDENDLRSDINITTRNSRRDNFNGVGGKFRGPETNWVASDFPKISSATFVAVDGGLESSIDLDMLFTRTPTTAQRIAKIALYRNREQITVSANFGLRALSLQVGDVIYINLTRAGWAAKTFEVQSWRMVPTEGNDLQIEMTLRELSAAVFNWSAEESAFEANNSNLIDPFYVVPIGLELTSEVRSFRESLTNVIIAKITASDPSGIERVEVQGKKSVDTIWTPIGTGQLGTYEYISVDDSAFDIRARAWNFLSVKSDWVLQTGFVVSGLAAPPEDVKSVRANVNGGTINLEWDPVGDLDLSYYKIRHSVEEAGATYANATTAVAKVSRPATSVSVPARPGTYTIKAYDKTGNASTLYNSVVVPSTALESFGTTTLDTESPTFAGTKTNCSVTSSELRINSTSLVSTSASGDGTTATIGFATQASAPFPVGSSILVSGIAPDLYNGNYIVTACTTTSVSFLSTAVGSQTVAGKITFAAATYEFTGYIDTLAQRRVRSRIDSTVNRVAATSGLWDSMSGLWDGWAGLWDDWTGSVQNADTDVKAYISITQTDPAASPVWSDWQLFKAGDFYGRAFKFKVELSSETADVTPSVSALVARVQY